MGIFMKKKSFVILIAVFAALMLIRCGIDYLKGCEHDWREATCEEARTCSKCGDVEGEPIGHDWQEATCLSPKKCAVCGKTEGKKTDHVWGEATCTEPGRCAICGAENLYAPPLGHDWMNATMEEPYICARCGEKDGEPIPLSQFNRGSLDQWKPYPTKNQFIGMSGYIAVTHCEYLYPWDLSRYENNWLSRPWYATTYEKDKQLWNVKGKVEHKTEVTVIGQELEDFDLGTYDYEGFLLVQRNDNGEQFYISVTDFVAEPYWETGEVENIGYSNPCLAVFHQKSDYYPVNRDNKQYKIKDGDIVRVEGKTNWAGIDKETNSIEAVGRNGRGYFNAEDLTIVY